MSPSSSPCDNWEDELSAATDNLTVNSSNQPQEVLNNNFQQQPTSTPHTFNCNAAAFIPNVKAAPFIPSFNLPPPTNPTVAPAQVTTPATDSTTNASPATVIDTAKTTVTSNPTNSTTAAIKENVPSKPTKKTIARKFDAKDEAESLNVVFIGHVDAGKSTIGGHIMFLTGMVDKRTLEKYEREAKEKNRESWYLSWVLDSNAEEREKGKTVEVGRAYFKTANKQITILDAPGHKAYVPNMIAGASQADVGILVISARKGEFEAGFDRSGQTREHAMLAKTAGIRFLIVLINKMDDPSVMWSDERYTEIINKLSPFLKKCGFSPKQVQFIPCSGFTGENLKDPIAPGKFSAYTGPSLLTFLDELKPIDRMIDAPVRMPIIDKFKDMGTIVCGKLESGVVEQGKSYTLMPNRVKVEVQVILIDEDETDHVVSGNNIKLKLKGVEEEDIHPGYVLCEMDSLVPTITTFDAQIMLMDLGQSILCAGFSCILHIHAVVEEVKFMRLIAILDKKTQKISEKLPRCAKQDQLIIARLQAVNPICVERFDDFNQLGRFTLRDQAKTLAIGKILKLIS